MRSSCEKEIELNLKQQWLCTCAQYSHFMSMIIRWCLKFVYFRNGAPNWLAMPGLMQRHVYLGTIYQHRQIFLGLDKQLPTIQVMFLFLSFYSSLHFSYYTMKKRYLFGVVTVEIDTLGEKYCRPIRSGRWQWFSSVVDFNCSHPKQAPIILLYWMS